MELETNTDSTRKLASIQVVEAVDPHLNADRLELVTVLGWQVCEVKGALKVGDVVVYCEIDSLLPGDAEWLPESVKGRVAEQSDKTWYRVKTIKLRGEITQGLIMPITDVLRKELPENFCVEDDVTKLLGIEKYERPALSGNFAKCGTRSISTFPSHLLDKTDETRVQSAKRLFQAMKGKEFYATVKMDGTSATYVLDPESGELLVCSRNQIRLKPENIEDCPYHMVAEKYKIYEILKANPTMAIQGEICGPNIQGNLAELHNLVLFVFNIVDVTHRRKLEYQSMEMWCLINNLPRAPVAYAGSRFEFETAKEVLKLSKGYYTGTKNYREGLVFRSQDQKVSFKAINDDFLLQKNKKEDKEAKKSK